MKFSCKGGYPHDYQTLQDKDGNLLDFTDAKYEICVICGHKLRWKKDGEGRVDNVEYLAAHIRNFCQPWGATRKVFIKLYHPQMNKSKICLNDSCVTNNHCIHSNTDTDYTKRAMKLDQKGSNDASLRKEIYGT